MGRGSGEVSRHGGPIDARHRPSLRRSPEVVVRAPNEVWSWDVTQLLGPENWHYRYLHLILDIFSRDVTGWMAAERETAGGPGS